MLNMQIDICRSYAEKCFRRAVEPITPPGFTPDWGDRPSYFKIYEGVERLALPFEPPADLLSMQELLTRIETSCESSLKQEGLTLDRLALMLYFAYGILNRRLRIRPDQGKYRLAHYRSDLYGRGTASGGGLYPAELYWACGSGGPTIPGLYHYDTAHHALERLSTGDMTRSIQSAVFAYPAALNTNQFLLITINFWKNAFKYDNFSYHVVTQDLGALLCSLWFLATGLHISWQPIFWYQDEALNDLLGLNANDESVLAVVPLPVQHLAPESESVCSQSHPQGPTSLCKGKRSFQRSRKVFTFEMNREAHQGTLITDEPRPDPREAVRAGIDEVPRADERIPLPPPALERLQGDLLETFQKRHSNFGTFATGSQLSRADLATILSSASAIRNYRSDVKAGHSHPHFTHLMVFINNVEGIERGAYAYDPGAHCLQTIYKKDMTLFLQQHYLLQNYNIADAGAVIAIAGNLESMLHVYGNRGYRLLNAEAGLVAQGIYMVSAAMTIACGTVLGFANFALNTALGLDGTDLKTLLFVLVGHNRPDSADIDYRLV